MSDYGAIAVVGTIGFEYQTVLDAALATLSSRSTAVARTGVLNYSAEGGAMTVYQLIDGEWVEQTSSPYVLRAGTWNEI